MAGTKDKTPRKVVIVDDEQDVVTYLTALLSDNDFEVRSATDGQEALRIIGTVKPDLICLDILMPGETGLSLYRKIRSMPDIKEIPVIIVSGMNYSRDVAAESPLTGSDIPPPEAYVEKPIKPGPFMEIVESVLG